MSWKKEKIGGHCEITSSKRIFYSEYVEKGVPFYRSKEIIERSQGQDISEPLYISLEKYNDIKSKFGVPQTGDMLLTSVGTIGVPYIVKDSDYFYFKDGNLTWFRDFQEDLSSSYLYYWVKSAEGYGTLNNTTIGSSQKALTISALMQIEIPIPPIETQNRIVEILASYDNLIENNQKQIKLLEEAAQRLYKEWFVDLRFPGYETTPVVDGVPEGWDLIPLGESISYEIGGGWGEEIPTGKCDKEGFVIRGTDFYGITHGDYNVPFRYHAASNLSSRVLNDGDIIFEVSGGSKTEGVARTAYITQKMIDRWKKPVMCASFCKLVRSKDYLSSLYLFNYLQYLRACGKTTEYDKKSASSIVNYRWKDFLSQEYILIPPVGVLTEYNSLAKPLQDNIVNCSLEIEKASIVRDSLLPKLMSGEIEV